ncbi:hypothetical protein BpHYR1_020158 [Brachionus plicatilis]|uniref:Uncharacterized protein n=1 Tax=Brachionus plicatilis TaxID=10195 RepID=A0A3M7PYQ6_BRAPC|nr:hypothetical protein BpHYR1_020158 [Brachionus plicatilis]
MKILMKKNCGWFKLVAATRPPKVDVGRFDGREKELKKKNNFSSQPSRPPTSTFGGLEASTHDFNYTNLIFSDLNLQGTDKLK